MAHFDETFGYPASDTLRRRVRRLQFWMIGFEAPQFVEQRVVLRIANLRCVKDMVQVAVIVERLA